MGWYFFAVILYVISTIFLSGYAYQPYPPPDMSGYYPGYENYAHPAVHPGYGYPAYGFMRPTPPPPPPPPTMTDESGYVGGSSQNSAQSYKRTKGGRGANRSNLKRPNMSNTHGDDAKHAKTENQRKEANDYSAAYAAAAATNSIPTVGVNNGQWYTNNFNEGWQ